MMNILLMIIEVVLMKLSKLEGINLLFSEKESKSNVTIKVYYDILHSRLLVF